ncbi:hypothetical protein CXB51_004975 [Gossypium anomalum]|uniref:DUF1117 domain-containing protein n=1 Tax=Gossypium anomalum TaxID=47600 RepID=A0A8J6D7H7_9ROSI|nr:hypothetical protein CXB51_004975 [Gossypium anomalum]
MKPTSTINCVTRSARINSNWGPKFIKFLDIICTIPTVYSNGFNYAIRTLFSTTNYPPQLMAIKEPKLDICANYLFKFGCDFSCANYLEVTQCRFRSIQVEGPKFITFLSVIYTIPTTYSHGFNYEFCALFSTTNCTLPLMVMKEPKSDILIGLIVWRLHDGGFAINKFPREIKGGGENRDCPMVYTRWAMVLVVEGCHKSQGNKLRQRGGVLRTFLGTFFGGFNGSSSSNSRLLSM